MDGRGLLFAFTDEGGGNLEGRGSISDATEAGIILGQGHVLLAEVSELFVEPLELFGDALELPCSSNCILRHSVALDAAFEVTVPVAELPLSLESDEPTIPSSYSSHSQSSLSGTLESMLRVSSSPRALRASSRIRRSLCFFMRRSASASKPHVNIEAGIANCATEKMAVTTTIIFVYQGSTPSGCPWPVSIITARYIVFGIELKSWFPGGNAFGRKKKMSVEVASSKIMQSKQHTTRISAL